MTDKDRSGLSFLEMVQSTLWAVVGVQKRENRVRDFAHGHWIHFIFMGVGFTALFVTLMIILVNSIAGSAHPL